jgi:hypothetical protein
MIDGLKRLYAFIDDKGSIGKSKSAALILHPLLSHDPLET